MDTAKPVSNNSGRTVSKSAIAAIVLAVPNIGILVWIGITAHQAYIISNDMVVPVLIAVPFGITAFCLGVVSITKRQNLTGILLALSGLLSGVVTIGLGGFCLLVFLIGYIAGRVF